MAQKYDSQIFRQDGKNCFVEVLNSGFPINKFQLSFCTYDETSKKQTQKLDIYMDVYSSLVLANDILTGNLARMVAEATKTSTFQGKPVSGFTSYFTDMGGMSEARVAQRFDSLKKQYPWLETGMAIARQFKIQTGTKYPWVLRAEYGIGKSTDKGLISMQGSPKTYINIPLQNEELKALAISMKIHHAAYLSQYYGKFGETMFKSQTCNVFTVDEK